MSRIQRIDRIRESRGGSGRKEDREGRIANCYGNVESLSQIA